MQYQYKLLRTIDCWIAGTCDNTVVRAAIEQWASRTRLPPEPQDVSPDDERFREEILRRGLPVAISDRLTHSSRPVVEILELFANLGDEYLTQDISNERPSSVWDDHGIMLSGETLGDGRYALYEPPVRSGQAEIWKAIDNRSVISGSSSGIGRGSTPDRFRVVALKRPHPEDLRSASRAKTAKASLLKEARRAALFEHPNICPVYFIHEGAEDEAPFYILRFLKEATLAEEICKVHADRRRKPPTEADLQRLVGFLAEAAAGVAYAHKQGFVHLDIKPSNIAVDNINGTQVFDWGQASSITAGIASDGRAEYGVSNKSPEATQIVLSTPAYAAPEQILRRPCSTRTDVFQLGAILYHILSGVPPCLDAAFEITLVRSALGTPASLGNTQSLPSLRSHRMRLLVAICQKAMQPKPEDRYDNVEHFRKDILHWLKDEAISIVTESETEKLGRLCRRYPLAAVSTFVAGLLLIGIASISTFAYFREAHLKQIADTQTLVAKHQEAIAESNADRAKKGESAAKIAEKQATEEAERAQAAEKIAAENAEQSRRSVYYTKIALAQAEYEQGNISRADDLLNQCPVDLRHWEWHYLRRLCHRPGYTLFGGEEVLRTLAWSADGSLIVAASDKGNCFVWDTTTRKMITKYAGHTDVLNTNRKIVQHMRLSPTTDWVASALFDDFVDIWEPRTGKRLHRFEDLNEIRHLVISRDGTKLAIATRTQILQYSMQNISQQAPELIETIAVPDSSNRVAFLSNGKLVLTHLVKGTLELWDTARVTLTKQRLETNFQTTIKHFEMLPDDSQLIATTDGGDLLAWSYPAGKRLYKSKAHSRTTALDLSQNGETVATCFNRSISLWNARNGQRLFNHRLAVSNGDQVAFNPTATWVAIVNQDRILVVPASPLTPHTTLPLAPNDLSADWSLSAIRHRDYLLITDPQRGLKLERIDLENGSGHHQHVAFTWKNQVIHCNDSMFTQTSVNHPEESLRLKVPFADLQHFQITQQNELFVWHKQGLAKYQFPSTEPLWELKTTEKTSIIDLSGEQMLGKDAVYAIERRGEFPNGYYYLVKYNSKSGQRLWENKFSHDYIGISTAAVSPDGSRILLGRSYGTQCYSTATGELIWSVSPNDEVNGALAWTPDSQRCFIGDHSGQICLVDANTGSELLKLQDPSPRLYRLFVSADGSQLLSRSSEGVCRVWTDSPRKLSVSNDIDLLVYAKISAESKRFWQSEGEAIIADSSGPSNCEIPVSPVGSYRLRGSFTRERCGNQRTVGIYLPVGNSSTMLTFEHSDRRKAGLDQVNSLGASNPNNPTASANEIKDHVKNEFEVTVELQPNNQAKIVVDFNRREMIRWSGSQHALRVHPYWQLPHNENTFGLSTEDTKTIFHELKLTMLDGYASRVGYDNPLPPPAGWQIASPGSSIDALALVQPTRDGHLVDAKQVPAGLQFTSTDSGCLCVPVIPQGDYRFRTEVTRTSANGVFSIFLPIQDRMCQVEFDYTKSDHGCAINRVDGKDWLQNETFTKDHPLTTGERQLLEVEVKHHGEAVEITALHNGEKAMQWRGNRNRLTYHEAYWKPLRYPTGFAFGTPTTYHGEFTIHSARVEMLAGEAIYRPIAGDSPQ